MTFEQIDSLLSDNKTLQRKIIKTLGKRNNQLATFLDLISITNSQEELERKRIEEIDALRIIIRKQISEKSSGVYTSLPIPLRYLAGELLTGNEEYVLNQTIQCKGKSIAAETIMETGFTTNQAKFLSHQMMQLKAITNSFEDAMLDSDKLKEVNFVLGAMDGDTLKHARSLVVLANKRAGQLGQLRIKTEMYKDHVKDYCKTCEKNPCVNDCPLRVFGTWK